jgi:uncharacterized protein (DUF2164 family)
MTISATNYSAEQTELMIENYTHGFTVEAIATEMGKSVRSVIAKLSKEGVYVAKSKVAKANSPTLRKAQLIELIAAKVGATQESLESLEKATKEALEILAKAI